MSTTSLGLPPALHDYLLSVSLRENDVQRRLREETGRLAERNMQIAPEQGQFMALLTELIGAQRAIEIGVFTGYSALAVAQAMPATGRLIACDVSEQWTAIGKPYWAEAGVADKIDLRLAPALQTLQALLADGEADRFDLAFIDADKERYEDYYEACLQLMRPGGLILIDNVLWDGKVADPAVDDSETEAIRALNEKLRADARITLSLVPIADGLTLCRKR
ncbi:MAG: class I SAM-dependent methyltransferase [Marivibrio sp.]|uniref:class I SAM-dependent methyltransferase n=1 Tax=Marivibrio sp. TaxID=2039719 RepID=UPI0032EEA0D2